MVQSARRRSCVHSGAGLLVSAVVGELTAWAQSPPGGGTILRWIDLSRDGGYVATFELRETFETAQWFQWLAFVDHGDDFLDAWRTRAYTPREVVYGGMKLPNGLVLQEVELEKLRRRLGISVDPGHRYYRWR